MKSIYLEDSYLNEFETSIESICVDRLRRNAGEVREITMAKAENKGKFNRRIYFSLED